MSICYTHITYELSPSIIPAHQDIVLPSFSASVFFDLSMQQEIKMIPESQRPQIVPQIFSSKYNYIKKENMFFTDGSLIQGLTGFGVFNSKMSISHKLQPPCICGRTSCYSLRPWKYPPTAT